MLSIFALSVRSGGGAPPAFCLPATGSVSFLETQYFAQSVPGASSAFHGSIATRMDLDKQLRRQDFIHHDLSQPMQPTQYLTQIMDGAAGFGWSIQNGTCSKFPLTPNPPGPVCLAPEGATPVRSGTQGGVAVTWFDLPENSKMGNGKFLKAPPRAHTRSLKSPGTRRYHCRGKWRHRGRVRAARDVQ